MSQKKKSKKTNVAVKNEKLNMIYIFSKSTDLAFSLTLIPVASLLLGIFLDKKFSTIPLFTIVGTLIAVSVSMYKIIKIKDSITKT